MSFKRRVGNFLILFGVIGLLVFAASVLAPPADSYDVPAFLAGAVLLVVGVSFRLSKSAGAPSGGERPAGAPAAAKAAPKSGPPGGGKPGGGTGPKKQSLANTIMKGPNSKHLPAAGAKAGPPGGGKPQGGKPAGKKK